jgi:hypothetical protein
MPAADTQKKEWIEQIVGSVDAKKADDEARQQKTLLLEQMRALIEPNKEQIKTGMTFQMIEKGKTKLTDKVLTSQGVGWEDQIETEDVKNYKWKANAALGEKQDANAGIQQAALANKAMTLVTELQNRLKAAMKKDASGKDVPLFNEQDLADEFWEPLYREGLVPENVIPKQYSNVQKMQEDTRNLYADWVKEQQAAKNAGNTIDSKGIITGLSGIGQGIAGAFGDAGEIAKAAISCAELTINTGISLYEGMKKSDYESIADAVMANVASFITAALTPYNAELASAVGGCLSGGAAIGSFAAVLIAKHPVDADDLAAALSKLGQGIGDGINNASGFGKSKAVQQSLVGLGTAFSTFVGNAGDFKSTAEAMMSGDKQAVIKAMTKTLGNVGASATKGVASALYNNRSSDDQTALQNDARDPSSVSDDFQGILDEVGLAPTVSAETSVMVNEAVMKAIDALGTSLATALKGVAPDLADSAASVFKQVISADRVSSALKDGKPQVGVTLFGAALEQAVTRIIPGKVDGEVKKVPEAVKTKFLAAAKPDAIKKFVADGNREGLVKYLTDAGDAGTAALRDKNPGTEEFTKRGSNPAKAKETATAILKQQEQEALEEMQKKQNAFKEELDALTKSDDAQRKKLSLGEGGQEAIKDKAIANLIMKIQIKRAVLEAAAKMAGGGMAIASQFVTGLGIGVAAMKFAQEVTEAATQAMELNKWLGTASLAVKGGSMYEPAIQNFISNRQAQIAHATIKAALAFAQMVVRSAETGLAASGYGAAGVAVTKAIDASLTAAAAAENLIYQVIEKGKVEVAWRMTRASLLNPDNRKLAKAAMKNNHTWAKYAIAYGATVKSDPIAVSAMNAIGLSQASLQHKDTDVQKVRAYLETLYNQDKQVLKDSPLVADWLPKKVELTGKCLAAAQRRGEKKGEPKLAKAPPEFSKALADLTRCDERFGTYQDYRNKLANKKAKPEELGTILTFLDEYRDLLTKTSDDLKYLPRDEKNDVHRGMTLFLKDLADRAAVRKEMISVLIDTVRQQMEAGLKKEDDKNKKDDKDDNSLLALLTDDEED